MAWEVRVTRISEEVGLDEGRMPTPYIRVEFTVGEHGPFVQRFPKKGFNPDLARQHLQTWAGALERMIPS